MSYSINRFKGKDRKLQKVVRRKKRGTISVPVSFPDPVAIPSQKKEILKGTTADLSATGLGIFSEIYLKPDTVIELECRDIWDAPKKFSVKWCNRVKCNFYRIGLEVKEES